MFRNHTVWPVLLFGACILGLSSCGGNSAAPATGATWAATTTNKMNVLNVATGPSGSPDCGSSWIANLQNISKATTLHSGDAIQIVSWNDYEHGDQIESGIDNCVVISPSIAGSTLSWQVGGNADAIDHFQVWDSANGQSLVQFASAPATARSLSLSNSSLQPGTTYALVIQAIGKPSVLNKVSAPISYTPSAPSVTPAVTLAVTPTSGVVPLAVSASATIANASGVSTSIDFGDGTVVAGTSATHSYSAAGNYTVTATATASGGASGKATAAVAASTAPNPAPSAQLSLTPSTGLAPLTVSASTAGSTVAGGSIASSKIDFGDGTVVTGSTASHTYTNPGSYTATATVTSTTGASATANQSVTATSTTKPASGAKLYIYPATAVAPRGSYQTITAIVNGVNDKTVTWSTSGGTLVGTNPCVVNEPCTIALYTTTPGTYTVTATSNADGTVASSSSVTITPSPTVTTGHPRLIITSKMLSNLQARATGSNQQYMALKTRASILQSRDTAIWKFSTWNGTACVGGLGPSSDQSNTWKEGDANLFAIMSMVAPTSTERNTWGCEGRDIFVYMMTQAMNGSTSFVGNHWSDSAVNYALTGDWLMGGGYLSSSDITTLHSFLAWAVKTVLGYPYGNTTPLSGYNSSSIFDTGGNYDSASMRTMGNNYTMSKMLYLAAAGLTFDDNTTDDPALTNTCSATRYVVCSDYSAGSLHAYFNYLAGSMLYKMYAHLEDPNVSWPAYNAAFSNLASQPQCLSPLTHAMTPCFGDGRGGESSEGSWYSYSLYRLRYALNAIQSAGYNDPVIWGPQISLATSSWWDLLSVEELGFLTGTYVDGNSRYNFLATGDTNTPMQTPLHYQMLASQAVSDSYSGLTFRTNRLLWPEVDVSFGGASQFNSMMSGDYGLPVAFDTFIASATNDFTVSLPTDPRPSLPNDIYNGGNQHILARTGWTGTDTLFSYYCPNTFINHENQFCGRFDIFSNGEYITKGRTVFTDYNYAQTAANFSNIPSYFNASATRTDICGTGMTWGPSQAGGGQWWQGEQAGRVTLAHAELPAYVATAVDDTNLYNSSGVADCGGSSDIVHASRSLIYLRGSNRVIYYDRGISGSYRNKTNNLITTGTPSVASNVVSWASQSGTQKAYWTTLLPSGVNPTVTPLTSANDKYVTGGTMCNASGTGQGYCEPEVHGVLKVDAGSVTATRFLSVLEWGNTSSLPSSTSLVQSSAGTNYDGALVGTSLAIFKRNWTDIVVFLTYPASGATSHYVADLAPNTAYSVLGAGAPPTVTTDSAGVAAFPANGTGMITVTK